jgi:quinol monooxygenase YgiN
MFVTTLRFTIQPEKKVDAISVLRTLCSQADVMPGCQLCRLYGNIEFEDTDDEILLIQRWDTKADMEKHILSPVFQQLIEIMDFATAPPELLFQKVSKTAGIEMVEDLCRKKFNPETGDCFH